MITLENKMAGGSNHLAGLHALRGFAAVMVFFFHLHFVGQIPLPKSWGLIASHGGYLAVVILLPVLKILPSDIFWIISTKTGEDENNI